MSHRTCSLNLKTWAMDHRRRSMVDTRGTCDAVIESAYDQWKTYCPLSIERHVWFEILISGSRNAYLYCANECCVVTNLWDCFKYLKFEQLVKCTSQHVKRTCEGRVFDFPVSVCSSAWWLPRSIARSIARSPDRSIARSIATSIARSLDRSSA